MRLTLSALLTAVLGSLGNVTTAAASIVQLGSTYDAGMFSRGGVPDTSVFSDVVFDGLPQTFSRTADPNRTFDVTITETVTALGGGVHLISIEFRGDQNLFEVEADEGFVHIGFLANPLDLVRPVTLESAVLTFFNGTEDLDLDDGDFLPGLASSFGSLSPWNGYFLNAPPPLFGGLGGIRDLNVDRITLDLRVREVPEPSTLALAALALAGLGVTVRRRRR
ncbi:MAG: PEP-CTERM sorting domain-containing protein [Steroidobacteraceae bacterium]|jgi:hypothetical protein|nr:PEP-CTERM sorting domain-containing protein [Steroidobacteraceae bacterium]